MRTTVIRVWIALILLAFSAVGQIAQNKPEFCGDKGRFVQLPSEVSAVTGISDVTSTLFVKTKGPASAVQISLMAGSIDQVCPIAGERLLVFGSTIPGAYLTAIVSAKTGNLLDSFSSYAPAVSPDQRWIIRRDFYPAQSEVPFSEEYLLYDLTKSPKENRMPGLTVYTDEAVGRVVYPSVNQGTPFEHAGLPENQRHYFASDSFYWSSDSRAVIFGDSVKHVLSAVLITTNGNHANAYVHSITATEACEQGVQGNVAASDLLISHAEVSPSANSARTIDLQFRSADYGMCRPKRLTLNREDFSPAEAEIHEPLHWRKESVLKQQ